MTDPHPQCSACGVPLKEKRTALTFRQWCPCCGAQTAFFRAWLDDVPPFVAKWVVEREQAEALDKTVEQA